MTTEPTQYTDPNDRRLLAIMSAALLGGTLEPDTFKNLGSPKASQDLAEASYRAVGVAKTLLTMVDDMIEVGALDSIQSSQQKQETPQ